MDNYTYRVERSLDGSFVGCYYGREAIDFYSQPLPRVAWWTLRDWMEVPMFDTGTQTLGSFALACSILAHHFGEGSLQVGTGGDSKTRQHYIAFCTEVIATQELKPGAYYIITTEVINEWLQMKATEAARRQPQPGQAAESQR